MRILPLVICLAAVAEARGSLVTLSSNSNGPAVFDSTNTLKVPNGSLVRVGTILNPADPAGSFVEFGTAAVRNAGFGTSARPGKITGSVTASGPESTHDAFNNRTIYLWVYNTPSQADATEQGIFGTSVVFPANDIAGAGDSIVVLSGTEIVTTLRLPGFTTAQILAGDENDSMHFVLGVLIPPVVLTAEASAPSIDGSPRLLLRAKNLDPYEDVILQTSTDLSRWSPLLTFPPGQERSEFTIDVPVTASQKYFRLAK